MKVDTSLPSLHAMLDEAFAQLTTEIGRPIEALISLAARLEMAETVQRLEMARHRLETDTFNLIILGRFKTGKSTLLNALLGGTTRPVASLPPGKGPMPTDDMPATATLTGIRYAEEPYVRAWFFDGSSEEWTLERYLAESKVREDEDENAAFFGRIRQFEVGFPAELCKSHVIVYDSPGLDDVPSRTQITRQHVDHSDAAIVVFRHEGAGTSELEFVRDIVRTSETRIFTVINLYHGRQVDRQLAAMTWNKLVKDERGGPKYDGQDFSTQDIYFIDALMAQEGKLTGNQRLIEESGLALFERRLGEFLLRGRHVQQMQKFARIVDVNAGAIEQQISQRRAALLADRQQLEQASAALQPRFEAIRRRRNGLPAIFSLYRRQCQDVLSASFETMIAQARRDLPGSLADYPLKTVDSFADCIIASYRARTISKEIAEFCNAFVNARLTDWNKRAAPAAIEPILMNLFHEISAELGQIDRDFQHIHFELTGWYLDPNASRNLTGTAERVLAGLGGLLLMDPTLAFGELGFHGLAANVAGSLGGAALLSAIGLAGTAIFLPTAVFSGILLAAITKGQGTAKKLKERISREADGALSATLQEADHMIRMEVETAFRQMEAEFMAQLLVTIEEEERNIQQMVDLNRQSLEERQRALAELDEAAQVVAQNRRTTRDILIKAQQSL